MEPEEGLVEAPGEGLVEVPGCGWVEVLGHDWGVAPGLYDQVRVPGYE